MTKPTFTKQHFRDLMSQIQADLTARDWKNAHQKARQYTQHMNQAFSEGYHHVALDARSQLTRLREPTYSASLGKNTYTEFRALSAERLYRAFVVEYCPLDPWHAKSFLLNDDSGSDSRLVSTILKNGFFRSEHLVDDIEKQSEAAPRLSSSLELISALLAHNNHVLAAKLIEGLLYDEDLRQSPFVFNDQVVDLLGRGGDCLFFRTFLERMAPRIQEICDWSHNGHPLREPCYKANLKAPILRLAEQGLPDLALNLYLSSTGNFENKNDLIRAEEVFERKFDLSMLVELTLGVKSIQTFEAFVEYFIHDDKNQWVFDNQDASDFIEKMYGSGSRFSLLRRADSFGSSADRPTTLKEQALVIQDAFERHKNEPGIEIKRGLFMRNYVASHIMVEAVVYKDIRKLFPMHYLMEVPLFAEERLQEDLGL